MDSQVKSILFLRIKDVAQESQTKERNGGWSESDRKDRQTERRDNREKKKTERAFKPLLSGFTAGQQFSWQRPEPILRTPRPQYQVTLSPTRVKVNFNFGLNEWYSFS